MEKMPEKKDDILKKLINPDLLEPAPVDFTNNIMASLGIEPVKSAPVYKPVISKQGWWLISLLIIGIYSWLLSKSGGSDGDSGSAVAFRMVLEQFDNAFAATFSGSGMVFIALASTAIFLLFLAESFFRQSRMKAINF